MSDERSDLISQEMPVQVRVDEKRTVQTVTEGGYEYIVEFTDPMGVGQNIRVSRRAYRQMNLGDTIAVYAHPETGKFVHESDPFAFARVSTSLMWVVAWMLIFIGVVDVVAYAIVEESPWCLVIGLR